MVIETEGGELWLSLVTSPPLFSFFFTGLKKEALAKRGFFGGLNQRCSGKEKGEDEIDNWGNEGNDGRSAEKGEDKED